MSKGTGKTELEEMLERKIRDQNVGQDQTTDSSSMPQGDTPDTEETAPSPPASDNETSENSEEQHSSKDAVAPADEGLNEATESALEQQIKERAAECEQLQDQLLRVRADFDNYRKRMLREVSQIRQTASATLIRGLLPALDNLERALAHADAEDGFVEGVGMVYRQFQEVLAAEGLEPIPALHESFDPNVHDALATMPSDTVEKGRIVEEYERGYRLRDTILRPSRVIVSSGPAENTDNGPVPETEAQITEATDQENAIPEETPEIKE